MRLSCLVVTTLVIVATTNAALLLLFSPRAAPATARSADIADSQRLSLALGELGEAQRALSTAADEARMLAEREAARRAADLRARTEAAERDLANCRASLTVGGQQGGDAESPAEVAQTLQAVQQALREAAANTGAPAVAPGTRACGPNGWVLINRCFCDRGWSGLGCGKETRVRKCNLATCYQTTDAGISHVPHFLWERVQEAERKFWNGSKWNNDRAKEHLEGFSHYAALPDSLGRVLEVGCGPFTQTRFVLGSRPGMSASLVTLLDPNAAFYMANTPNCPYRLGRLGSAPTVIVNAMAEDYEVANEFDTVVMTDVLEHAENAPRLLQNIFNALRVGGRLVLQERYLDGRPYWRDRTLAVSETLLFHFLRTGFREEYLNTLPVPKRKERSVYFIGTRLDVSGLAPWLPSDKAAPPAAADAAVAAPNN